MKHTITLDGTHTVTKGPRDKSWIASVTADLAKLPTDVVVRLAVHGLQQKIADAAAGATTETEATAAMQKALDAVMSGEWTSRTAGAGVDERTRVGRQLVRAAFKTKVGGKSPEWAAFTGLADDAQAAKLDEWLAANADAFGPAIDAKLAELAAERENRAKLGSKVSFEI